MAASYSTLFVAMADDDLTLHLALLTNDGDSFHDPGVALQ